MSPSAYPDLLAAWWREHADGPCGWEPPAEAVVRAWAEAERELDAAWLRCGAAQGSAFAPLRDDVIELRELAALPPEDRTHWIEVRVVDDADAPIVGVKLTLIRPDGARERASTGDDGVARWRKLPHGRARVIFHDDAASFAEVG